MIDSERQLSGKVVNEDTRDVLERLGQVPPEHLCLIDAILTLPKTSLEKEYRRRIAAINAVTAYLRRGGGATFPSYREWRSVEG